MRGEWPGPALGNVLAAQTAERCGLPQAERNTLADANDWHR